METVKCNNSPVDEGFGYRQETIWRPQVETNVFYIVLDVTVNVYDTVIES